MGGLTSKPKPRPKTEMPPRHSETPPAWEKVSESPVQNRLNNHDQSGSSSYNLLDLQGSSVYKNRRRESPIISRDPSESRSDISDIEESPTESPRSEASSEPSQVPSRAPSRAPSSVRKGLEEDNQKFALFKNVTAERDSKSISPRPPPRNSTLKPKMRIPVPIKKNSQMPKTSPKKRRPESLPSSPAKSTKKLAASPSKRRGSDISTITLNNTKEDNNNYFRTVNKKLSVETENNNLSRAPSREHIKTVSRKTSKNPNHNSSNTSKAGRIHPGSSDRLANFKKLSRSNSNLNTGGDFTSLMTVKSATHSVQSTMSNFEVRTKIDKFDDKKQSLAGAGINKLKTLNHNFKEPKWTSTKSAFDKAKKQLESSEWENVLDGILIIIALAKKEPEILLGDLKNVLRLMIGTLKNLRSQVCRTSGQAFAEMYLYLGKAMELELDKVVLLLLQKSADTNKFIRDSASEALTAMAENVSVYRAVTSVSEAGLHHKSNVVRGEVSRIFDHVVTQMGAERVMGSSREFQERVFSDGAELLTDGSLDVRTHAKKMYGELKSHSKFESSLKEFVKDSQLKLIQKALDSIKI